MLSPKQRRPDQRWGKLLSTIAEHSFSCPLKWKCILKVFPFLAWKVGCGVSMIAMSTLVSTLPISSFFACKKRRSFDAKKALSRFSLRNVISKIEKKVLRRDTKKHETEAINSDMLTYSTCFPFSCFSGFPFLRSHLVRRLEFNWRGDVFCCVACSVPDLRVFGSFSAHLPGLGARSTF